MLKNQPTKEEILTAIQIGTENAFSCWLDQLYVADVFKCIENGIDSAVYRSFPTSTEIKWVIEQAVRASIKT